MTMKIVAGRDRVEGTTDLRCRKQGAVYSRQAAVLHTSQATCLCAVQLVLCAPLTETGLCSGALHQWRFVKCALPRPVPMVRTPLLDVGHEWAFGQPPGGPEAAGEIAMGTDGASVLSS